MIYPVIDTLLRPIRDDLAAMFSSFGDVAEAAMNKVDSFISPVNKMAEDLGTDQFINDMKPFIDKMLEHYFVKNEKTKKFLTDVSYIFQIDPKNVYMMSKSPLDQYINRIFENAPDEMETTSFYLNLSYDDWADHKLITSGLRKFAARFSKFLTVMENRAVERGFVCPKQAMESVYKMDVAFNFYGNNEHNKDSGLYNKDIDDKDDSKKDYSKSDDNKDDGEKDYSKSYDNNDDSEKDYSKSNDNKDNSEKDYSKSNDNKDDSEKDYSKSHDKKDDSEQDFSEDYDYNAEIKSWYYIYRVV